MLIENILMEVEGWEQGFNGIWAQKMWCWKDLGYGVRAMLLIKVNMTIGKEDLEFNPREEQAIAPPMERNASHEKGNECNRYYESQQQLEELSSDEDDARKSSTVSENDDVTDEELQISKYHQDNILNNR